MNINMYDQQGLQQPVSSGQAPDMQYTPVDNYNYDQYADYYYDEEGE